MAHVHATGLFTRNDPAGTSRCTEVYGKQMRNEKRSRRRSREPRRSMHEPTATNISKIKLLKMSISAFLVRHISRKPGFKKNVSQDMSRESHIEAMETSQRESSQATFARSSTN